MPGSITDVHGIEVGHFTDIKNRTGCTVILCRNGAVAGIDIRGFAAGTRQVNSLEPLHPISRIDAVCLAGGAAFGLDTASGVAKYLLEHKRGFNLMGKQIPIVPTAVIFDLFFAEDGAYPNAGMAYKACVSASSEPPAEGSVGAGTGATVGKILTLSQAMKGGVGTASTRCGDATIGALAVVNSFGDVVDSSGNILAGARTSRNSNKVCNTRKILTDGAELKNITDNTTLVVVATDAFLSKEDSVRLAIMAQDGIAHSVAPSHTLFDGDIVFVLSTGSKNASLNSLGSTAQELVAECIRRGIITADGMGKLPAYRDLKRRRK